MSSKFIRRHKKAISPLIATVLLISFTFTIAAILAGWGQNISTQTLSKSEKQSQQFIKCGGGTIKYLDVGISNPLMVGNQIKALIEVDGVSLGNFTFQVTLSNLDIKYLSDSMGTSLGPGARNRGTIASEPTTIARENITSVIITSNCTEAKTDSRPLG